MDARRHVAGILATLFHNPHGIPLTMLRPGKPKRREVHGDTVNAVYGWASEAAEYRATVPGDGGVVPDELIAFGLEMVNWTSRIPVPVYIFADAPPGLEAKAPGRLSRRRKHWNAPAVPGRSVVEASACRPGRLIYDGHIVEPWTHGVPATPPRRYAALTIVTGERVYFLAVVNWERLAPTYRAGGEPSAPACQEDQDRENGGQSTGERHDLGGEAE